MPVLSFDQILINIRNRVFHPIYFLMGEEPYFIDVITHQLEENVLEEDYKAFNLLIMYGRDVDVHTIANQARTYPMSGNYQLIIVKEAQDVRNIEELDKFIPVFPESTILVINYKYKKIDGRRSFAKTVEKKGILFESKKLRDYNMPDWINSYLKNKGYGISPKAAQIIADFLGTDLHKVRNELEKVLISSKPGSKITEIEVETNIGISKDFNIFELQSALTQNDKIKANRIVLYFAANSKDNPIIKTIILLYSFFIKVLKVHYATDKSRNTLASYLGVHPFFVADYQQAAKQFNVARLRKIIGILRQFDLKAKGYGSVNTNESDLYKEMIYRIMH